MEQNGKGVNRFIEFALNDEGLKLFVDAMCRHAQNPALMEQMAKMDDIKHHLLQVGITVEEIDAMWAKIGYSAEWPKLPTITTFAVHVDIMRRVKEIVMRDEDYHPYIDGFSPLPCVFHPVTGRGYTLDEAEVWFE